MTKSRLTKVLHAARHMDWFQVLLNQGPPCFHVEDNGRFCGRAERWEGHGHKKSDIHRFVSLEDLLIDLL